VAVFVIERNQKPKPHKLVFFVFTTLKSPFYSKDLLSSKSSVSSMSSQPKHFHKTQALQISYGV